MVASSTTILTCAIDLFFARGAVRNVVYSGFGTWGSNASQMVPESPFSLQLNPCILPYKFSFLE